MVYEFDGTKHGKLRDMQAARRAKHPDLARGGTDFTQATHAAGTPKRTGKAWRRVSGLSIEARRLSTGLMR